MRRHLIFHVWRKKNTSNIPTRCCCCFRIQKLRDLVTRECFLSTCDLVITRRRDFRGELSPNSFGATYLGLGTLANCLEDKVTLSANTLDRLISIESNPRPRLSRSDSIFLPSYIQAKLPYSRHQGRRRKRDHPRNPSQILNKEQTSDEEIKKVTSSARTQRPSLQNILDSQQNQTSQNTHRQGRLSRIDKLHSSPLKTYNRSKQTSPPK